MKIAKSSETIKEMLQIASRLVRLLCASMHSAYPSPWEESVLRATQEGSDRSPMGKISPGRLIGVEAKTSDFVLVYVLWLCIAFE